MKKNIVFTLLILSSPVFHIEAQITVGAMAELSGQYSKVGEDCRRGYELAEKIYNTPTTNSKIRVVLADNGGDAKKGLNEFQRLVSAEEAVAVVTSRSSVGLAVNPVSKQRKIPVVGIVGHPAFISDNPYSLRVFPSSEVEGKALAAQIIKLNRSRIATITLEDDYFLGLTNAFESSLGKNKIVFAQTVVQSENDFGPMILRLKADNPDGILLNVGPAQIPTLLKRIREQRINAEIFSNFLISTPDIITSAGNAADGVIFVQSDFEKPVFLSKLKELFSSEHSSPVGYSCFLGLASILNVFSSPETTATNFKDKLLAIDKIQILGETITFINREAQLSLVTRQIRNGVSTSSF